MEEIWKDVVGYEGLYQISNFGIVKSLWYGKERILKPSIDKYGYLYVHLCKDGKKKKYLTHRIVATAFIDNPKSLPCVNHKDEDKTNNKVDNLEWCTYQYNCNYGTRLQRISEANKGKKRLEEIKGKMRESSKKNMVMGINKKNGHIFIFQSIRQAGKEINISYGHISECCKGKRKSAGGYIWEYVDKS